MTGDNANRFPQGLREELELSGWWAGRDISAALGANALSALPDAGQKILKEFGCLEIAFRSRYAKGVFSCLSLHFVANPLRILAMSRSNKEFRQDFSLGAEERRALVSKLGLSQTSKINELTGQACTYLGVLVHDLADDSQNIFVAADGSICSLAYGEVIRWALNFDQFLIGWHQSVRAQSHSIITDLPPPFATT